MLAVGASLVADGENLPVPKTNDSKPISLTMPGVAFLEGTAGYQYVVRLPDNYGQTNRLWPLIVVLHGAIPNANNKMATNYGPMRYAAHHTNFPFMVASPVTRQGWSVVTLRVFMEGLHQRSLKIDWDRVYLTGESMGGHATWGWALADPVRFAALVPICAAGDPRLVQQRLSCTPVWIFHGEKDRVVPVAYGKAMFQALQDIGAPVKATFYPDRDHDSWTPAYRTEELYEWLLKQSRPH